MDRIDAAARPRGLHDLVAAFPDKVSVVAGATDHQVDFASAIERIIVAVARQRIGALFAKEQVEALTAAEQIVVGSAQQAILATAAFDRVVAGETVDEIVGIRAKNFVGKGIANSGEAAGPQFQIFDIVG